MAGPPGFPPDMPGLPVTDLQYNNARTYTSTVAALFALSCLILAMRLAARWKSNGLKFDDYSIVGAAVFGIVDMAVVIDSFSAILGPVRPDFLPFSHIEEVAPLSLVSGVAAVWSVALVKVSIGIMLLRLLRTRSWTIFLNVIIGLQFAIAIFVTIMQTTRCIPIKALWNPTITDKRCWGEHAFKVSLTTSSVFVIVTDVVFALIPLTFLHHIRRSLRDRLIIGFLMGLGLFASAASIVKTTMVQRFDEVEDPPGHGMSIALWASVEAQVGIIAACIPCLRAACLRVLERMGLVAEVSGSGGKETGKLSWQGVKGASQFNTRSVRLPGGPPSSDAFGCGPRTMSTKIVANESDEDVLVPERAGSGVQRGRIQRKTEIDIELASVGSN